MYRYICSSFLPLSATAQGELWPPEQSASILLYIHPRLIIWFLNNFVFYGLRLLVSRPTPNLGDQGIPLRLAPTP
jgi:hypothetical protein